MKKTNTTFWIVTILFAAFMTFSSIPNILNTPETVVLIHDQLGYPLYFIPFIGVVKLLGIIAILIPAFPRIKEWAYAGLAYDLIGAVYSCIVALGFDLSMLIMLLPIGLLATSYLLHHKRLLHV